MVRIEYWNGKEWVFTEGLFRNEAIAWISLGGDDINYRTVDVESGNVLKDKRERVSEDGSSKDE